MVEGPTGAESVCELFVLGGNTGAPVLVAVCRAAVTPERSGVWANGLFAEIHPEEVICISSLPVRASCMLVLLLTAAIDLSCASKTDQQGHQELSRHHGAASQRRLSHACRHTSSWVKKTPHRSPCILCCTHLPAKANRSTPFPCCQLAT